MIKGPHIEGTVITFEPIAMSIGVCALRVEFVEMPSGLVSKLGCGQMAAVDMTFNGWFKDGHRAPPSMVRKGGAGGPVNASSSLLHLDRRDHLDLHLELGNRHDRRFRCHPYEDHYRQTQTLRLTQSHLR